MVCIYCGSKTNVVNSRHQRRANQVWRRRRCTVCYAVFTSLELVDTTQALRVHTGTRFEPFSRDNLLLSVYDSLRHRNTAVEDATALTSTIMSKLQPVITDAVLERDSITEIVLAVLTHFDKVAATHFRAFHPV